MPIRKIVNEDLKQCAGILESAYEEKPYFEKFEEGNALKYIEEKFKSCAEDSFVICQDSEILGFVFWTISCWTDGPQAVLEEIVIDNNHQGKGLGKQLIEHSDQYLLEKGIKSIMLWAINSPKVMGFHERNGFEKSDEFCVMFKNIEK